VTFTADKPDPVKSHLDLDKTSTTVGSYINATTTVVDKYDNVIVGWSVSYGKKSTDITLSKASCTTLTDGKCTVTVTSTVAKLYPDEVSAKIRTEPAAALQDVTGSPATVEFTHDDPGPDSSLTLDKTTTPINTFITATATIVDAKGNPIPGYLVTFTKKSPEIKYNKTTCTTLADGKCSITVTSAVPKVYDKEVGASVLVKGNPMQLKNSPATVEFTFKVSEVYSHFTVEPDPNPFDRSTWAVADGVDYYTGTFDARDEKNMPIVGIPLDLLKVTVVPPVIKVSTITDNKDGTYTMKFTSEAVVLGGFAKLEVMEDGAWVQKGKTATILFQA